MLSHLILQLESIDGPEKVRRHLSIRGGAHVDQVRYSPPWTVFATLGSIASREWEGPQNSTFDPIGWCRWYNSFVLYVRKAEHSYPFLWPGFSRG